MIRFSNFHYNREPSYFFIFLSQMYYTLTLFALIYTYHHVKGVIPLIQKLPISTSTRLVYTSIGIFFNLSPS